MSGIERIWAWHLRQACYMFSGRDLDLSQSEADLLPVIDPAKPFWRAMPRLGAGWLHLPATVWSRLLALFFALAAIKIALLFRLGKHLFEIHWRVGGSEFSWVNQAAFLGLIALGVLSVLRLGKQCQGLGVKAVRGANAAVLSVGFLFLLLTFHIAELDKNYVFPVISGVLDWKNLTPYLKLDFLFRAPFLAAWVAAYAFGYWVLVRKGGERWALHWTAGVAGVYALLCLRDLAAYRNEILAADCLGLVALLVPPSKRGKLRLAWVLTPLVWSALFAGGLLRMAGLTFEPSLAYFVILSGGTAVLFTGLTFLAQRRGFLAPWLNVVLFYFSAFLLLTNSHFPLAPNLNQTMCLGLEFPHYFAGELAAVVLLAATAKVYRRVRPRGSYWWLDVVNLFLITIALADLRLSQIIGTRLEWNVLTFGNSPKMMWRMASPYLPGLVGGLAVLAAVYFGALRGLRSWREGRQGEDHDEKGNFSNPGARYAAAVFSLLCLLGIAMAGADKGEGLSALRLAQTSPLWKRTVNRTLSPAEFLRSANALGMGDFQQARNADPALPPRDLNVVLIFQESTYNKHLSLFGGAQETQPLLSKYKDRMEIFPDFFSNFASSIHARFATFTSLYPAKNYDLFTLERVNVKSIFEALHDNGYNCSLFYSSFFDYTGFGDFLKLRGIDEMYDAETMPGQRTTERVTWGLREEETLGAIRGQIKKYATGRQRFFLTYVPAAPHYPYEKVPEAFHKFKPGAMGDYTPLYLNELLHMDWVIASIIDQLKESGLLEKTLVVITDDHGEMLGTGGEAIGHGWVLTPDLVNAPLIIMDPEHPGYRLNTTVGSQVDLLPTLLDRLRLPMPAGQLYQGRSLDTPVPAGGRLAYLNAFQHYGVLRGGQLVLGDRQKEEGRGPGTGATAYAITNQGPKTLFIQQATTTANPVSILHFDEFQENLLRNYSYYARSIQPAGQVASQKSAR